jgi:hypothetical protein
MVPLATVPGDSIFLFFGGQVLYVLRGASGLVPHYIYRGEAYVHGLMDGEVMNWVHSDNLKVQSVVLI